MQEKQKISDFFINLKKLCQNQGVSLAKMQHDCGLGTSTVYRWKRGDVTPNAATVGKIATYFNVSTDEIMLHTPPYAKKDDTPATNNNVSLPNNKTSDNTNTDLISIIKSQHETLHKQHETLHRQHETLHEQQETLREQLQTKDGQMHTKDEQLYRKDEQQHDLTEIIKKKDEQQHDLTRIIENLTTKDKTEPQKQVQPTKKGRSVELAVSRGG